MSALDEILIIVESVAGRLSASTHELIAAGLQLARPGSLRLNAQILGESGAELAHELIARGVDRVYVVPQVELTEQVVEARLPEIVRLCRQIGPKLVLLAHGVIGAELAPRLAFRLDGAAAIGCVGIEIDADSVCCTRPCYGGIAHEVDRYAVSPLIATVRAGVFEPAAHRQGREGEIISVAPGEAALPRTRLLERKLDAADGVRLEDARVIVAGGRGLEGPDGFRVLEGLARELDAVVGASRVPCDLGWCPHSWQIGLTGKTVTPELYIAVGISGAGHHMAGCGNAKAIVAINTDAEAQIFQDARLGVVGDYREVVPALAAELHKLRTRLESS